MNNAPKKVVILSKVNFTRSYSGVKYLADAIYNNGNEVEIYAHIPRDSVQEIKHYPYHVHSCYEGLVGRIPWVRGVFFRLKIRRRISRNCDVLIVNFTNPVAYVREGVYFKKLFPGRKLIHYCPELWVPGEKTNISSRQCKYYLKNANIPDLIVDVDANRAKVRSERIGITGCIETLPNTLPQAEMPKRAPIGTLASLAGAPLPKGKKILLYTGVITASVLAELTSVMSVVMTDVCLLWFAQGPKLRIESANIEAEKLLGKDRMRISTSIPRANLLSAMYEADAGLIAYSWRDITTVNQMYAAPTKLFEYLASGLPVVSYGNPTIKKLVEDYNLGEVSILDAPESLGDAINQLFLREGFHTLSTHVRKVFDEDLCYEKASRAALSRLVNLTEIRVNDA